MAWRVRAQSAPRDAVSAAVTSSLKASDATIQNHTAQAAVVIR
jgi:hypothetical protein